MASRLTLLQIYDQTLRLPLAAMLWRRLAWVLLLAASVGGVAAAASDREAPEEPAKNRSSVTTGAGAVSVPELNRQIEAVIRQDKYAWRSPREKATSTSATKSGVLSRFIQRAAELIEAGVKNVFQWLGKALEWLARLLERLFGRFFRLPKPSTPGYGWMMGLNVLLYMLVAAVLVALGYLGYRIWLHWRPRETPIASEPIQPAPDVADENVSADQLPEDGWLKLARELLARGELRLGLRAFYLASLASLAAQNLLAVAKFKSNRDYERELGRRGRSFPELLAAFAENVAVFDRVWYGLHEVNLESVNAFATNVERMRTAVAGKVA